MSTFLLAPSPKVQKTKKAIFDFGTSNVVGLGGFTRYFGLGGVGQAIFSTSGNVRPLPLDECLDVVIIIKNDLDISVDVTPFFFSALDTNVGNVPEREFQLPMVTLEPGEKRIWSKVDFPVIDTPMLGFSPRIGGQNATDGEISMTVLARLP